MIGSTRILGLTVMLLALGGAAYADDETRSPLPLGPFRVPAALDLTIRAVTIEASTTAVRARWEIVAGTDRDVAAVLVQPLPDLSPALTGLDEVAKRKPVGPDFIGVGIEADGKPVKPEIAQRATAAGLDVTERLIADGLPVDPWIAPDIEAKLAALAPDKRRFYAMRGMAQWFEGGPPMWGWTASTVLWWPQTFAAGKAVATTISYAPVTGTALLTEATANRLLDGDCRDAAAKAALGKALAAVRAPGPSTSVALLDRTLDLNFEAGPTAPAIGRFTLKVARPSPTTLVVSCGLTPTTASATEVSFTATEFSPPASVTVHFIELPKGSK
ncbi:MAG: DUF4424 domain-containing protein [Siculibacillus sp.]|nr:DUF4424 domain-containing protein [Siculibacillus sp.]